MAGSWAPAHGQRQVFHQELFRARRFHRHVVQQHLAQLIAEASKASDDSLIVHVHVLHITNSKTSNMFNMFFAQRDLQDPNINDLM